VIDVTIHVDGVPRRVAGDQTLAVALIHLDVMHFRRAIDGTPRAPLCAMGTCHECRVEIDGSSSRRACMEPVRDGMQVETGA
jgi:sarcosine oxidase subunit alpha